MADCSLYELAQHLADGQARDEMAPRFALFLGAGASIESHVDSTEKMMETFQRRLRERWRRVGGEVDFEKWLREQPTWKAEASDYSNLFEAFEPMRRGRARYIEQLVARAAPSCGYLFLTQLLAQGYLDTVITTNFDDLVYEACARWSSIRPRVYAYGAPSGPVRHQPGRPSILKLHGDFLHSSLLKNTEGELSMQNPNMEQQVRNLLRTYELIVIGYSGSDNSIMDILEEVSEDHDGGVYWCMYGDQPPSQRARELLKRRNWFLVRTNGFEAVMGEFLHTVKFVLPEMESTVWNQLAATFKMIMESGSPYRKYFLGAAVKMAKAEAEHSSGGGPAAGWVRAFLDALVFFRNGDTKGSIAAARRALALDPNDASTLAFLGFALTQAGFVSEAIEILRDARARHPRNADVLSSLGFSLTQAGQASEALGTLRDAQQIYPDNTILLSALSYALTQVGDAAGAIAVVRRACELDPVNADLLGALGFALTRAGRTEEALTILRQAQALYPDNADVLSAVGFALLEGGLMSEAIVTLRHARECRPDSAIILADLGEALYCEGSREEAKRDFEQLLEMTNDSASDGLWDLKLHGLGLLWVDRSEEALDIFKKLIELRPRSVIHLRDSLTNLRRLTKFGVRGGRECLSLVEKAVSEWPSNPESALDK